MLNQLNKDCINKFPLLFNPKTRKENKIWVILKLIPSIRIQF